MVSKALVVGAYQRKLEELALQPDVELTVIVPSAWREGRKLIPLERAHTEGYDLLVAPLAFNGQFHLHFYPTLGRHLRQLRPDILHMDEEPYNLATWLALRQGQAVDARCLFFTWQNLIRHYPAVFRHFEAANWRRAAHAIAGNPTAADVLRAKGYRGPVTVIPQFGVDPHIFSPRPDDADGTNASADDATPPSFVIGYAGRLVPEKGVAVLLRACASFPAGLAWSLRLLADGPDRERLTTLAADLGIADRVDFLGRVPSTQAPEFYRTLDVLVLPSLSRPNWVEQFGRVLTEAMACGVPVVGSQSGEIPWVIGDAGRIFPEGDAAALANILMALADDPVLRAALAAAGRARILTHFTQAQVAAETAAVYREMLHGSAKLAGG